MFYLVRRHDRVGTFHGDDDTDRKTLDFGIRSDLPPMNVRVELRRIFDQLNFSDRRKRVIISELPARESIHTFVRGKI